MKLTVALLLFAFSTASFAQGDDQVRIDALQEINLTNETVLSAYVKQGDQKSSVYGMGDTNADVSCNLSASNVALSNFDVIKSEKVGSEKGLRVYLSPKQSIKLVFSNSRQGVEETKASCNGEPELCDSNTYYVYRTQIITADKTGNTWNLNCVAPFSRPVLASDVKISGIEIK